MPVRRCLSVAAAVAVILTVSPIAGAVQHPSVVCRDCSVLLISLDTLRADALGAYSPGKDTTPHLDGFAASGTLFLDAFSQAPQTTASHMSIFTGRQPWNHRVEIPLRDVLDDDIPTLAEILGSRGYDTAWIGPKDDFAFSAGAGFERGFQDRMFTDPSTRGGWAAARSWLADRHNRKTFLFLHSYHAHDPYIPYRPESLPAEDRILVSTTALESRVRQAVLNEPVIVFNPGFVGRNPQLFRGGVAAENWPRIMREARDIQNVHLSLDRLRSHKFFRQFDLNDPLELRRLRRTYEACVRELDGEVGEVLSWLDQLGVSSRTIVVVTSDHGEQFMEHGRLTHATLDVECLKVPLLVRIPGAPQGLRVPATVQSVDILPTILEPLGLPTPTALDGVSLLPLMAGENPAPRPALAGRGRTFAYRDGSYAYRRWDKAEALFESLQDRRSDPQEMTDLSERRPDKLLEYRRKMEEAIPRRGFRRDAAPSFRELDPLLQNSIMQTGYW